MRAQLYRKARGVQSAVGASGEIAAATGLGLLPVEQVGAISARQQIIQLYDDSRPSLQAYLCCLGMSADQAEDVIQETFLRLVRYRAERDREDNLRAWVFRVAHNLSMDVHRFQRRWSLSEDDEQHRAIRRQADPAPSPEQQVILDERMKRFEAAFTQLTPKQRQCVLLRAEGFRYREIAVTLGISVQRVGELMQRSITLLGVRS